MAYSFPHPAATILVVDDEAIPRRVIARMLGEEGYRVLEAASCAEALDALHTSHGRVELVMLDVVMPDCDGVALAGQIRETWPTQRLLFMSAHPAEILMRHGLETLDVPFLAKPYSRPELLAKVRQALTQQPRQTGQGSQAEPQADRM